MKQHITPKQLEGLSDKAKKKLIKWWKPKVGDFCYMKDFPNKIWTAHECVVVASGYFLRKDILSIDQIRVRYFFNDDEQIDNDMNLYLANPYRVYNEEKGLPISDKKSYLRPFGDIQSYQEYNGYSKDFLPLLSVGQMIEILGEIWSDPCIDSHDSEGWIVYNTADDKEVYEKKELCDALWEPVKEVLEKHKELVEEDENGHDVQCSSGVGLNCDCWKLKDVKSHS